MVLRIKFVFKYLVRCFDLLSLSVFFCWNILFNLGNIRTLMKTKLTVSFGIWHWLIYCIVIILSRYLVQISIFVIFLETGTVIGWFLVTCPWLKSNVFQIMIHWVMYPTQDTLQHVIKAWWKVAWQKVRKTLSVFFFVNEHNTNMKPQAKKQRFSKLSQKKNSS